jgi:hypothetical protein
MRRSKYREARVIGNLKEQSQDLPTESAEAFGAPAQKSGAKRRQ